jgi:serine-type D-Ala-D-Ala carboxypeptidase (penicillin-binding protein 5/6)
MTESHKLARRALLLAGAAALAAPSLLSSALAAEPHRRTPGISPALKQQEDDLNATPAQTPLGPVNVLAKWAYIEDFNTGATLLNKAGDEAMPPSSMTKLMTAYIVYSQLKAGKLHLDQMLPVSEKAWRMQGSKMFVPLGQQVQVEDLIRGMIVDSGNDACIVLAEGIAGSEDSFVDMMNAEAKKMGLEATHFVNATGWPDPGHTMSAKDIATVATHIIKDFPDYYHYDSEKTFKFNNIQQGNRNTLVWSGMADGLKTGHTEAGGYGIVVTANRNGRRVVVVLNGMPTMRVRGEEAARMLDWAFSEFEDVKLFTAGDVVDQAKVWLGSEPTVPLVSSQDVTVTLPRNWRHSAKLQVNYQAPLTAPVAKGQAVGQLTASGQGVPDIAIPLVAGADVGRMPLPERGLAVLARLVTGS